MPKQLVNLSIPAPGFFGLNKQASGSLMEPGWASEAYNVVFDNTGRVASRMGYRNQFSSNPTGTPKVIHEYVDGAGNKGVIFANNNTINKDNADGTFTAVTGTITTPTADNWQFVNFNGKCVGFQASHAPIVATAVGGNFADIVLSGTQQPTTAANAVCAAFGRLWVVDGTNLKYSDLLDHTAWNGVFDLSKYWKSGMDEGVAVAEYNGYLLVFGKDNIIVFNNPYDPASTMQIVENIGGIGCVERDSIQDIGTDLLFFSRTGVRSLGRTIQEKSLPIRGISKNIKDYILQVYAAESGNVKSTYNSKEGFYILSFPSNSTSFVFDLKAPMQDGSIRVTEWNLGPTALEYTLGSVMYMGFATRVAKYSDYLDDMARDGTGGNSYNAIWLSGWNDFGEEVRGLNKILKKLSILMGGISNFTVTAKWAFDYVDSFYQSAITFTGGGASRYGVAKYTIGTYSGLLNFTNMKTPLSSQGQVVKFGVDANVSGEQVILQRLDIMAKVGRQAT